MHRMSCRLTSVTLPVVICALTLCAHPAGASEKPEISHVPIPLAAKGKPLPVIAEIKITEGKISSATLSVKSSKSAKGSDISMTPTGEGKYHALIPGSKTSGAGLLYQITVLSDKGESKTSWYPVVTEAMKDAAKDKAKEEAQKTSRIARAKAAIASHPYISAGAAIGVVGVAAAGGGGGGGDGGGGAGGSFAGVLSGNWSGSGLSGTFSVTVAPCGEVSGSYQGDVSGSLSGEVASDGSFSASGSTGGVVWQGTVSGTPGDLSASGTWTGYGHSGSWSGSGG